ncbi:peptidylprolyl isomerase [Candidatus Woesearchaeota archaeon]|nr:peptidylprolyl isomerase [Candidatus Woesearchaeota archaeon]
MGIKKGEFIELNYIGRVKENNQIFDLTEEKIAKENNIFNPNIKYHPVIICIGEGDVLKGLDEQLIGKEINQRYTIDVKAEKAFGKRNAELIKLVPQKRFTEQDIRPFPGLQINFGGAIGTVKIVSGGRILVDFNHPLAGKELSYEIEIERIIKDNKEIINGFLEMYTGIKDDKLEATADKVTIHNEIPNELKKFIEENLKKRLPKLKKIEFKGKV